MRLFLESEFETFLPFTPAEFQQKLGAHVQQSTLLEQIQGSKGKEFFGDIGEGQFRIWRNINYRNSALPILKGQYKAHPKGIRVHVEMRPNRATYTFVCTWAISTLGVGLVAAIFYGIFELLPIICLILFGTGIGLAYRGFWAEVKRSKELFQLVLHDKDS